MREATERDAPGGWRRTSAVACALLAVLASSCWPWAERPPLVVAFTDLPETLDPHLQNHNVTWSVLGNVFDALVRFSPAMELEPALALTWERQGESSWRVALRPGVRFQDGSSFSAADVVSSFERARSHPRSRIRHFLLGVTGMRELDDLTVEIATSGPVPDLFNRLSFLFIVPRGMAGQGEITDPIGTGPYRFAGRNADGSIRLEGWKGWRGAPPIEAAVLRFFANDDDATAAFLSRGVDVLHSLPDGQLQAIQRQPGLRAEPQPRLAVQLLAIAPRAATGAARRALADPRVRRALLLALDRRRWTNDILLGNGTVAPEFVHPVVFGFDPEVRAEPCDLDAARRLLAEAGFPDGFEAELGHGNIGSGAIEAIVADLARVGVRVKPVANTFSEVMRLAREGKLPLVYYAWACSTGDASDFLNTSIHSPDRARGLGADNFGGYADAETDALLEAADRERDLGRRLVLLQRAQRRALAALPVLPLTIRWGYEGVSARVDIVTRHDEKVWLAAFRWRN